MNKISAILLAAGESTRMGEVNKLLLPFGDKTMVEHIIVLLLQSEIEQITVVIGHESDKVKNKINHKAVHFVFNKDYKTGMTSSIKTGLREHLNDDGVLVCLGDMPFLKTADINLIIKHFQPGKIIIPSFKKKMRNPVLFSKKFFNAMLQHKEKNGCKAILQANEENVISVEISDGDRFIDIDKPEDYDAFIKNKAE